MVHVRRVKNQTRPRKKIRREKDWMVGSRVLMGCGQTALSEVVELDVVAFTTAARRARATLLVEVEFPDDVALLGPDDGTG